MTIISIGLTFQFALLIILKGNVRYIFSRIKYNANKLHYEFKVILTALPYYNFFMPLFHL
jgi:hypothetical protein